MHRDMWLFDQVYLPSGPCGAHLPAVQKALVSLIKYREAEVILARPSAGDDDRPAICPTWNAPKMERPCIGGA